MEDIQKKNEDTKKRLIEAAGELFARRGFRSATVREICSLAGAHVGAVNYHFRDKEGLYAAVLEHSHQLAMRRYPPDLGLGNGATPEEKLRAYIHSFLLRILAEGFPAWHGKLMAREISIRPALSASWWKVPSGPFICIWRASSGNCFRKRIHRMKRKAMSPFSAR